MGDQTGVSQIFPFAEVFHYMKLIILNTKTNYSFSAFFYGLCDATGCQSYFLRASIPGSSIGGFRPTPQCSCS